MGHRWPQLLTGMAQTGMAQTEEGWLKWIGSKQPFLAKTGQGTWLCHCQPLLFSDVNSPFSQEKDSSKSSSLSFTFFQHQPKEPGVTLLGEGKFSFLPPAVY